MGACASQPRILEEAQPAASPEPPGAQPELQDAASTPRDDSVSLGPEVSGVEIVLEPYRAAAAFPATCVSHSGLPAPQAAALRHVCDVACNALASLQAPLDFVTAEAARAAAPTLSAPAAQPDGPDASRDDSHDASSSGASAAVAARVPLCGEPARLALADSGAALASAMLVAACDLPVGAAGVLEALSGLLKTCSQLRADWAGHAPAFVPVGVLALAHRGTLASAVLLSLWGELVACWPKWHGRRTLLLPASCKHPCMPLTMGLLTAAELAAHLLAAGSLPAALSAAGASGEPLLRALAHLDDLALLLLEFADAHRVRLAQPVLALLPHPNLTARVAAVADDKQRPKVVLCGDDPCRRSKSNVNETFPHPNFPFGAALHADKRVPSPRRSEPLPVLERSITFPFARNAVSLDDPNASPTGDICWELQRRSPWARARDAMPEARERLLRVVALEGEALAAALDACGLAAPNAAMEASAVERWRDEVASMLRDVPEDATIGAGSTPVAALHVTELPQDPGASEHATLSRVGSVRLGESLLRAPAELLRYELVVALSGGVGPPCSACAAAEHLALQHHLLRALLAVQPPSDASPHAPPTHSLTTQFAVSAPDIANWLTGERSASVPSPLLDIWIAEALADEVPVAQAVVPEVVLPAPTKQYHMPNSAPSDTRPTILKGGGARGGASPFASLLGGGPRQDWPATVLEDAAEGSVHERPPSKSAAGAAPDGLLAAETVVKLLSMAAAHFLPQPQRGPPEARGLGALEALVDADAASTLAQLLSRKGDLTDDGEFVSIADVNAAFRAGVALEAGAEALQAAARGEQRGESPLLKALNARMLPSEADTNLDDDLLWTDLREMSGTRHGMLAKAMIQSRKASSLPDGVTPRSALVQATASVETVQMASTWFEAAVTGLLQSVLASLSGNDSLERGMAMEVSMQFKALASRAVSIASSRRTSVSSLSGLSRLSAPLATHPAAGSVAANKLSAVLGALEGGRPVLSSPPASPVAVRPAAGSAAGQLLAASPFDYLEPVEEAPSAMMTKSSTAVSHSKERSQRASATFSRSKASSQRVSSETSAPPLPAAQLSSAGGAEDAPKAPEDAPARPKAKPRQLRERSPSRANLEALTHRHSGGRDPFRPDPLTVMNRASLDAISTHARVRAWVDDVVVEDLQAPYEGEEFDPLGDDAARRSFTLFAARASPASQGAASCDGGPRDLDRDNALSIPFPLPHVALHRQQSALPPVLERTSPPPADADRASAASSRPSDDFRARREAPEAAAAGSDAHVVNLLARLALGDPRRPAAAAARERLEASTAIAALRGGAPRLAPDVLERHHPVDRGPLALARKQWQALHPESRSSGGTSKMRPSLDTGSAAFGTRTSSEYQSSAQKTMCSVSVAPRFARSSHPASSTSAQRSAQGPDALATSPSGQLAFDGASLEPSGRGTGPAAASYLDSSLFEPAVLLSRRSGLTTASDGRGAAADDGPTPPRHASRHDLGFSRSASRQDLFSNVSRAGTRWDSSAAAVASGSGPSSQGNAAEASDETPVATDGSRPDSSGAADAASQKSSSRASRSSRGAAWRRRRRAASPRAPPPRVNSAIDRLTSGSVRSGAQSAAGMPSASSRSTSSYALELLAASKRSALRGDPLASGAGSDGVTLGKLHGTATHTDMSRREQSLPVSSVFETSGAGSPYAESGPRNSEAVATYDAALHGGRVPSDGAAAALQRSTGWAAPGLPSQHGARTGKDAPQKSERSFQRVAAEPSDAGGPEPLLFSDGMKHPPLDRLLPPAAAASVATIAGTDSVLEGALSGALLAGVVALDDLERWADEADDLLPGSAQRLHRDAVLTALIAALPERWTCDLCGPEGGGAPPAGGLATVSPRDACLVVAAHDGGDVHVVNAAVVARLFGLDPLSTRGLLRMLAALRLVMHDAKRDPVVATGALRRVRKLFAGNNSFGMMQDHPATKAAKLQVAMSQARLARALGQGALAVQDVAPMTAYSLMRQAIAPFLAFVGASKDSNEPWYAEGVVDTLRVAHLFVLTIPQRRTAVSSVRADGALGSQRTNDTLTSVVRPSASGRSEVFIWESISQAAARIRTRAVDAAAADLTACDCTASSRDVAAVQGGSDRDAGTPEAVGLWAESCAALVDGAVADSLGQLNAMELCALLQQALAIQLASGEAGASDDAIAGVYQLRGAAAAEAAAARDARRSADTGPAARPSEAPTACACAACAARRAAAAARRRRHADAVAAFARHIAREGLWDGLRDMQTTAEEWSWRLEGAPRVVLALLVNMAHVLNLCQKELPFACVLAMALVEATRDAVELEATAIACGTGPRAGGAQDAWPAWHSFVGASICASQLLLRLGRDWETALSYARAALACVSARVAAGAVSKHHHLHVLALHQAGVAAFQELNNRGFPRTVPVQAVLDADALLVQSLQLASASLGPDHPVTRSIGQSLLACLQVPMLRRQQREASLGLVIRIIKQRMESLGWDSPALLDSVFVAARVLLSLPGVAGAASPLGEHLVAVLKAVLQLRQLCLGVDNVATGEAVDALYKALIQTGKVDEAHRLKQQMWDSYVTASKTASISAKSSFISDDLPRDSRPLDTRGSQANAGSSRSAATHRGDDATPPAPPSSSRRSSQPRDWAALLPAGSVVASPAVTVPPSSAVAADGTVDGSMPRSLVESTRESTWSLLSQTVTGEVSDVLKGVASGAGAGSGGGADGAPARRRRSSVVRVISVNDTDVAAQADLSSKRRAALARESTPGLSGALRSSSIVGQLVLPLSDSGSEDAENANNSSASVYIPTLGLQCASNQTRKSLEYP